MRYGRAVVFLGSSLVDKTPWVSSEYSLQNMNKSIKGFAYVSVWILLWGVASSVADAILLERGAYLSGTAGQVITFASYGAAAVVMAVRLSSRFLKSES